MSVVISDPGAGEITVSVGARGVEVTDSDSDVDVIESGGQVVVRITSVWAMVKVQWNGGTSSPTILGFVSSDGVITQANCSIYYYGGAFGEWAFEVDFYASGITRNSVSITPTSGDQLQVVTFTGYSEQGLPNDFRRVTFITKSAVGTAIQPPSGNVCWLTFGPP